MTDVPGSSWESGLVLQAGPHFVGLYQPSPETAFYWEGVGIGELRLRWCEPCGRAHHPKRIACPGCGNTALGFRSSAGRGKVYSFSILHRAPAPAFAASVPYAVGLVELDEGVFLLTRFVGSPAKVAIGAPVELEFQELEGGQVLPVFRPVA